MAQELFDKTVAELREAFVRARFAEPAMFGRADIETWIDEPTDRSSLPWLTNGFLDFLDRAWNKRLNGGGAFQTAAGVLVESATTQSSPPDWLLEEGMEHREDFFHPLMAIGRDGNQSRLYFPEPTQDFWPIVCLWPKLFVAEYKSKHDIFSLRPAKMRDVCMVLYGEMVARRPKAAQAERFLDEQYRQAIAAVRKSAERDFDEAVAVTTDGTKIVKAKWVVVASANADDPSWIYPSSAFLNDKIRRPKNQDNFRSRGFASSEIHSYEGLEQLGTKWFPEPDAFRRFTDDLRHHFVRRRRLGIDETQRLVWVTEHLIRGVESVLIAMPDDCPSPLPVGDRKLR